MDYLLIYTLLQSSRHRGNRADISASREEDEEDSNVESEGDEDAEYVDDGKNGENEDDEDDSDEREFPTKVCSRLICTCRIASDWLCSSRASRRTW